MALNTSFSTPSVQSLITSISTDLNTRMVGEDSLIKNSLLYVVARVLAGAIWPLYYTLGIIANELFVSYASAWGLAAVADRHNVPRQQPDTSTGTIDVTGTSGNVIPISTELTRGDGYTFTTDAAATVSGAGTVSIAVTADDTGLIYNSAAGVSLEFSSPIAGVDSSATVDSDGLTGGADLEDLEDWRERILEKMRARPQGGAESDYIIWGKEVSGVDEVWATQELGLGTVSVRFTIDDTGSGILPDATARATVLTYIQDTTRKPITADVYTPETVALLLQLDITGPTVATGYVQADVRTAIEAELEALLVRKRAPGSDGKIYNWEIRQALGAPAGVVDYSLTDVNGDGSGTSDVTPAIDEIMILDTVSWS